VGGCQNDIASSANEKYDEELKKMMGCGDDRGEHGGVGEFVGAQSGVGKLESCCKKGVV
jgi:hypothetical protein